MKSSSCYRWYAHHSRSAQYRWGFRRHNASVCHGAQAGVSTESAADVMKLADEDGDGQVTFEEFKHLMKVLKKSERRRHERRKDQRAEHK